MTERMSVDDHPLRSADVVEISTTARSATRPSALLIIFLLVGTWVGQSEVAQVVETAAGPHGKAYNRPCLLTWINHSASVLLLPLMVVMASCIGLKRPTASSNCSSRESRLGHARRSWLLPELLARCNLTCGSMHNWALLLAVIYLLADYLWYIGLAHTSVAAGTALFNTMALFTYVLGIFLGREQASAKRTVAVLLAVVGVLLICSLPGKTNLGGKGKQTLSAAEQIVGSVLVIFAAFSYSVYQLILDSVIAGVDGCPLLTNVFVAVTGVVNVAVLWPCPLLASRIPAGSFLVQEPISLPPDASVTLGIAINAGLALCFNILLALAVVRTSPLVTSCGCMLSIPASLVVDACFHGDSFSVGQLTGSVLIILGFIGVSL